MPDDDLERLTAGYGLIEGPVWDPGPRRGRLLFSDVLNGGVYAIDGEGSVTVVFEHRRGIGGMALQAGPGQPTGLIVSGRNISYKPFDGGHTITVLDRDEENGLVGFNDIATDAHGRIYAGGLGASPLFGDGRAAQPGDLFLIEPDGSSRIVARDVLLTNGLGLSPGGRLLYHSDSGRQSVFRYEVHHDGSLGPKQLFVTTELGVPDGLAVSEDGAVWVALAGGGKGVSVYERDGSHRRHIGIPEPMCTSVCFGGPDLRHLYIVSGSDGSSSDRAGAVYRIATEVAGLSVPPARLGPGVLAA